MSGLIDLSAQRFGRLTVIKRAENLPNQTSARWLCKCDCGKEKIVSGAHLRRGEIQSCGCLNVECTVKSRTTHGLTRFGKVERLYKVWAAMKQRTVNPKGKAFKYYGGKGVFVCEEWLASYVAFRTWALEHGYDPSAERDKCTIDRIDNKGCYSPENCRWVDRSVQGNNKSNNHILKHNGIELTMAQWTHRLGIGKNTIGQRLRRGWSVKRALTQPVSKHPNFGKAYLLDD